MKYALFFDGGATPNPGVGECGYVLWSPDIKVCKKVDLGDNRTNNEAEWLGLIHGLKAAIYYKIKQLTVYGDSNLVINQIQNNWKVKSENLIPLYEYTNTLLQQFDSIQFKWVKRDLNYAGIMLEHGEDKMKVKIGINNVIY